MFKTSRILSDMLKTFSDTPVMSLIIPTHEDCQYAACFCEENVYKLIQKVSEDHPESLQNTWAVFISNSGRCVPLWSQKAGREGDGLVIWDYHVILLYKEEDGQTLVYDLDTRLPFPAQFPLYSEATLTSDEMLEAKFHRQFRVIPGAEYLASLSTDRRHMKNDEGWLQAPPSWPCIKGKSDQDHNLDNFIDMDDGVGNGKVMTLKTFIEQFS